MLVRRHLLYNRSVEDENVMVEEANYYLLKVTAIKASLTYLKPSEDATQFYLNKKVPPNPYSSRKHMFCA